MSTTEAAASEPKPSQTYPASCHCGYIRFSVTLSPPLPEYKPLECNCSACRRFGYLLVCKSDMAVQQSSLALDHPSEGLNTIHDWTGLGCTLYKYGLC